jgi:hypothetical protein
MSDCAENKFAPSLNFLIRADVNEAPFSPRDASLPEIQVIKTLDLFPQRARFRSRFPGPEFPPRYGLDRGDSTSNP